MRRTALTLCLLASAAFGVRILVAMQAPAANYDESKIPAYTLPDPLVLDNGGKVASAREWASVRRPELLARFATVEYGSTPTATLPVTVPLAWAPDGAFLTVGYGRPFAVTDSYRPPATAPSSLVDVRITVGSPPPLDIDAELARVMRHQ